MAKKKSKKKSAVPKKQEEKLRLTGTFDEILKATLPKDEQKKK